MSTVQPFDDMLGVTMATVSGAVGDDEMRMTAQDGRVFRFWHDQSCCESVRIEDVVGDLSDLVGSPILLAEEVSSLDGFDEAAEADRVTGGDPDSYTWTFYRFATAKGAVTVRWFGESNGYYSESVSYAVSGGVQ